MTIVSVNGIIEGQQKDKWATCKAVDNSSTRQQTCSWTPIWTVQLVHCTAHRDSWLMQRNQMHAMTPVHTLMLGS